MLCIPSMGQNIALTTIPPPVSSPLAGVVVDGGVDSAYRVRASEPLSLVTLGARRHGHDVICVLDN